MRAAAPLEALVAGELPSLVQIYEQLHAHPELSYREEKTSAYLARELRKAGYEVAERFGEYGTPGRQPYGVVAVLKNGPGPTLLLRSDMDALPVEEKTGLPYASKVRVKNDAGEEVGVMHACGHDLHMATLIGAARALSRVRERWSGTLLLAGQPAEEVGSGARSLLKGGLYERFPRPDFAFALHSAAELEAGKLGYSEGPALASSTRVDLLVRGKGGHGAFPQSARDPVVLAAQLVLALQTIVSREMSPLDPAVVTVGSIHGGTKHNVIPDEVALQLTVRAYKAEVRERILAAIERIAKGLALGAGLPESLAPVMRVGENPIPAVHNHPQLTKRLAAALSSRLGAQSLVATDPVMGAEDFSHYSLGGEIPTALFWVGAADPARAAESRRSKSSLPSLHSALYAPAAPESLRAGVLAMSYAALELLPKPPAAPK